MSMEDLDRFTKFNTNCWRANKTYAKRVPRESRSYFHKRLLTMDLRWNEEERLEKKDAHCPAPKSTSPSTSSRAGLSSGPSFSTGTRPG
jgi:hypothetical protein